MNTGCKTIAVHVNDSLSGPVRTRLAARLACRHGAHLVGMAARGLPFSLYMGGLTGDASYGRQVAAANGGYQQLIGTAPQMSNEMEEPMPTASRPGGRARKK